MTYSEWEENVPEVFTADPLWHMRAYRFALFVAEVAWHDVTKLDSDRRPRALADQLYRAVGSVSANLSEGYSRGTGKDRARFYEYALGSAREARGWYYKGRHVIGGEVATHRMALLTDVIRLILSMLPHERSSKRHGATREPAASYETVHQTGELEAEMLETNMQARLEHVPLPR